MEFETRRLDIKKFIPEYMGVMYETWGTNREVGKYIQGFRTDWTREEFEEYVLKTYRDEFHTRMVIQERSSNEIIGNISLYQEDSKSKSVTIWLIEKVWNKGYGKEALKGVIRELKKTKLDSIYATCDERNIAAVKLLKSTNFELIDVIKDAREDIDGNLGNECLYELVIKK